MASWTRSCVRWTSKRKTRRARLDGFLFTRISVLSLIHMKMKNGSPVWYSLGHAVLVLVYISSVAWFMTNAETILGEAEETFLIPVAMLMLLVLSAAVMGLLVFGRPILMYLDGKKREAVMFLGYTIGWLTLLTFLVFVALAVT